MPENKLQMTFDPNTIEHLGVKMYSTLPPVLAELIANAYDAYAENVTLTLKDKGGKKEIIIEDDGEGMSFDEINDKFLKIGRNRRKDQESALKRKKTRKMIGKKGLGKLSFFGITNEVEISTKKDGEEPITFVMSWEGIKNTQNSNYTPEIITKPKVNFLKNKGTKIILKDIKRKTGFDADQLAVSLSRMIIFSDDFKVTIKHNEEDPLEILNQMRYKDLEMECEWKIPRDISDFNKKDYLQQKKIKGHLIATKKPIKPKTGMKGISLFSRTKQVNKPEYFSNSQSSHFFSYLTGYLEVDFIDNFEEDMILTNRQSLHWDHEDMQTLRENLKNLINFLEQDWREKRKHKRNKKLKKSGVDTHKWFSKLPKEHNIKESVKGIVINIVEKSEMTENAQRETVSKLRDLVPEYPKYHWRHLHPEVQDASKEKYESGDYYGAFHEAVKRYENKVRKVSGLSKDKFIMGSAFGDSKEKLTVTEGFKKSDGSSFNPKTISSIEEGQKFLSIGIITGGRNPIAHEEIVDLKESGLFTKKDCLDALSLLSHLFGRLDNAKKKK